MTHFHVSTNLICTWGKGAIQGFFLASSKSEVPPKVLGGQDSLRCLGQIGRDAIANAEQRQGVGYVVAGADQDAAAADGRLVGDAAGAARGKSMKLL